MEKKNLALISFGHLSCDINGGALPACLPYLRAAQGLDYQATAGFMFAYSCLSSLTQPLLGFLADKHKKPWFVPLGILLGGCCLASIGFIAGYWAIFVCVAICGIGSAFFHPEGARFANRFSGKSKGIGMSLFSIGGNSGFILGPLLVAFFVGAYGLPGMGIFGLLAIFTAAVLCWQIAHLLPRPSANNAAGQARYMAADPAAAEGDELASESEESACVNNWRGFSRLLVVILCRAVVFTGCNTFIPLYWVNGLGMSPGAGATALVIFGAFGIACNIAGGYLSDRLGYVAVIRLGFCFMAPALILFAFANNIWGAYLLLPFIGGSLFLPFSAQVVFGQKLLAKNIGFASGVTLGLATTIGGVCQPGLGWIADTFELSAVFLALSGAALLGCLFTFSLSRKMAEGA